MCIWVGDVTIPWPFSSSICYLLARCRLGFAGLAGWFAFFYMWCLKYLREELPTCE